MRRTDLVGKDEINVLVDTAGRSLLSELATLVSSEHIDSSRVKRDPSATAARLR